MSSTMRWGYGDTNPVVAAVDSATVVEIGDLLWQDVNQAKPARAITDDKGGMALLALTNQTPQEMFARTFLGVAMERSVAGDTDPIRVATTGVFEFDCPSGTFELGDLVGVDEDSGGKALLNQQVDAVTASEYAIARVARRESLATTSVLVAICSTVMTGGILTR